MSYSKYYHYMSYVRFVDQAPYQGYDDFAVRVRLEVVRFLELLAQYPVVVDLAVDSKRYRFVLIDKRLCAAILDS